MIHTWSRYRLTFPHFLDEEVLVSQMMQYGYQESDNRLYNFSMGFFVQCTHTMEEFASEWSSLEKYSTSLL